MKTGSPEVLSLFVLTQFPMLPPEAIDRLDTLTTPVFTFPQSMQSWFPAIHNGGTRINGLFSEPAPFGIGRDEKPY